MDLVQKFTEQYGKLPTEFDPDYLEMLRMTKYRILDVPDLKPGKCANCGSSKNDGRKYIDFQCEVDWYGIVFLCGKCLSDVATQMGLFVHLYNEIEFLKSKLLDVVKAQEEGINIRDDFLKIFKEVQDYFISLPATGNSSPASSDDSVVEPKATNNEPSIDTIKSAANAAKSGTSKSATGSGSKKLPSLAELLNATE